MQTPPSYVIFSIPGTLDNDVRWTLKVVWEDGHVSVYQHDPQKHTQYRGGSSMSLITVAYFALLQDSWNVEMSPRSSKILCMTVSSLPTDSESTSETLPKTQC